MIKQGEKIGKGTRLNCMVDAFGSEPYLITVGENCLFSADIYFVTHDGGVKVLNSLNYFEGKRKDNIAPINIGNNVYIGMGAYIMPGVSIGDNCIIGARAVVTHDVISNSVAVGIPAKNIKTIDEYYQSTISKGTLYDTAGMSREEKRKYFEKIGW